MSYNYAILSFPSHLNFLNIISHYCEDIIDVSQILIIDTTRQQTKLSNGSLLKRLCVKRPHKCKDLQVYCSICCDNVKPTEFVRSLPCSHNFHKKCVDKWFVMSMKETEDVRCPLCREKIELCL